MQENKTKEQVAVITPDIVIETQIEQTQGNACADTTGNQKDFGVAACEDGANSFEQLDSEQTQLDSKSSDNEKATSYGKFKSAESLYEGYQRLEKEFTKKCQVLRELEGRVEDSKQILEKMIEVNPNLVQYADALKTAGGAGELSVKLAEQLVGKINEPCNIINDEEFLNNYVYSNESIINKIVADYLDSLVSIKIPQTISKGGSSYVSPTYRPRTLDEAGKMAKKFIETRRF